MVPNLNRVKVGLRKRTILIPRELVGIEKQAIREARMMSHLKKLPDDILTKIAKEHPGSFATEDDETFSNVAVAILLKRQTRRNAASAKQNQRKA